MTTLRDYYIIWKRRGTWRLIDEFRENYLFDWRHGTDTQSILPLENYTAATDETTSHPYVPAYTRVISEALQVLQPRISGGGYTFVDIGCGKGKVLILAAESRLFKEVVGIEIEPSLAEIARSNVGNTGFQSTIKVVQCDARDYSPYPKRAVIFMYNPFGEERVGECLKALHDSACEDAFLIYFDPRHGSLLNGWELIHRQNWRKDEGRILAIYRSTADS